MKYYFDFYEPGWVKVADGSVVTLTRYIVTDFRPPLTLSYRAREIVLEDGGKMVWLKHARPWHRDSFIDPTQYAPELTHEEQEEVLIWALKARHYTGSFSAK